MEHVIRFAAIKLMKKKTIFFALLASLAFSSGLRAQYRWHIVYSNHVDSTYYGFQTISCFGENCSVAGDFQAAIEKPDSEFIIHSTDGGLTWISVDSIPQVMLYPRWGARFYWYKIQQIDSLDAIAVDELAGAIVQTFDGWQTFQTDTTNSVQLTVNGQDTTFSGGYYDVNFSNAAEGMLNGGFGFYYSTLDSGKHWDKLITNNAAAFHSYGSGMFRVFVPPNKILTTYDDWRTLDTSLIVLTDSIESSFFVPQFLTFGGNDSLVMLSLHFDSTMTHYSLSIAISSDLGQNWQYPLHDTVALDPLTISPLSNRMIAIAGEDSSGRIVMSTDQGATWHVYSVPLDNGVSYYSIISVAVTGSGRVIASIQVDSSSDGSVLAYLEPVPSSVVPTLSTQQNLTLYPNPATNILNIAPPSGTISILDPLGRSYTVPGNGDVRDVSSLPPGVYFVSDGASRAKFVKK